MKTALQIAEDCGLHEREANLLDYICFGNKIVPPGMGQNAQMFKIITALYRRIETLEEQEGAVRHELVALPPDDLVAKARLRMEERERSIQIAKDLSNRNLELESERERAKLGPRTLDAKWLDPECWDGCQSLVFKNRFKVLLENCVIMQSRVAAILAVSEAVDTLCDENVFGDRYEELLEADNSALKLAITAAGGQVENPTLEGGNR